jgi:hypothetical protein
MTCCRWKPTLQRSWLHTERRKTHCSDVRRTPSDPHCSTVHCCVQCHIAHIDSETDFWTVDCVWSQAHPGTSDRYTHTEAWRARRPLHLQRQSQFQDQKWSAVSHKVVSKFECPGCTSETRSLTYPSKLTYPSNNRNLEPMCVNVHFSDFWVSTPWSRHMRCQWFGDLIRVGYLCIVESPIPQWLKQFDTSWKNQ